MTCPVGDRACRDYLGLKTNGLLTQTKRKFNKVMELYEDTLSNNLSEVLK
jgi:hypothetical protein